MIGIVSSGITYREVRESFARLGLRSDAEIEGCGIRLLKMGMPMPFDPETVRRFAVGLQEAFVIEEKRPNLESLIKDALYGQAAQPRIVGKQDEAGAPLVPGYGALDADALIPVLRRRLGERLRDRAGLFFPGGILAAQTSPKLFQRFFPTKKMGRPIPMMGSAIFDKENLPMVAMIHAVRVVPRLAPMMTPMDSTRVSRPALTKLTTMTVVADEDWMRPVVRSPVPMPVKRLWVMVGMTFLMRSPAVR